MTTSRVRDNEGKIVRYQRIAREVREQKIAQEAARQAEERVRLLAQALESTSELICITDLNDRFIFVNKAFLEAYGYSEKEILGKHPNILRSPKVDPAMRKEIWKHTRRGGWAGELLDRRKNGSEFPIALTTFPVKDSKGNVIGLIGAARDISDLKREEETLRQSEARLTNLFESNPDKTLSLPTTAYPSPGIDTRAMSDLAQRVVAISERMGDRLRQVLSFASLTSHELRTPLSIVRNQLEEVLRPKVPIGEMRKTLASIYDEILRLDRIVDNLLSLATLQAGKFKLDLSRVPLHRFLKDFCEEASILAREKDIRVLLKRMPKLYIQADRIRMQQVLFALFDNALKHAFKKGRIRVGFVVDKGHVAIFMADSGKGIPPEMIEKIFDPFYKADSDDSRGVGLGLALVKWIIEAHRGTISVQSKLGKGSTFTIRLPIKNSTTKKS